MFFLKERKGYDLNLSVGSILMIGNKMFLWNEKKMVFKFNSS